MAAASIGSNHTFVATSAQTLHVHFHLLTSGASTYSIHANSAVYIGIIFSHAVICCLGTAVLARLQTLYVILNVL